MSVTINSNNGSVIYAADELFAGAVLAADQTVTNSATLVNVPALKIPVGKFERVLFMGSKRDFICLGQSTQTHWRSAASEPLEL